MAYGKRSSAYLKRLAFGEEIIQSLSKEQREYLASKSGTLHFVQLLGFQSIPGKRSIGVKGKKEKCPTKVGITLRSDEDIEVPVMDILLNNVTGINPKQDISFRKVKANEEFDLSYYEMMFLIIRDEYAGYFCSPNGDPRGGYVSFNNWKAFENGEVKLPTPMIQLKRNRPEKTKSAYEKLIRPITEYILPIDEKDPDGNWIVKPQYREKFGPLLEKMLTDKAEGKKRSKQAYRELLLTQ
ncbi:hypothetical protein [Cohnella massiliensis]|uniref:hypothetical protein n=1 Tax=Cohnella massiliensis TaxID=1816691 RepID=UPI0009BABCE8|nr:hypothetical protein [Cohnella massiliensis]